MPEIRHVALRRKPRPPGSFYTPRDPIDAYVPRVPFGEPLSAFGKFQKSYRALVAYLNASAGQLAFLAFILVQVLLVLRILYW